MRQLASQLARIVLSVAVLAAQDSNSVQSWIKANAVPLKTVEAGNGFDDLKPLKPIIGDARIVSLGEATHGTREFFQLKHRVLEYLVTELGFRIFSIEANMPEAYALNDYVLTGKGDPAALLKGMYFWTWNTEEVLSMIQWMRQYNLTAKEPLQFTGFDMQTPNVAAEIVRRFVATQENDYAAEVAKAVDMAIRSARQSPGANFGVATSHFDATPLRGKTLRFTGWIRTEDVTRAYAGLWMRVDGKQGERHLAFDNMADRGVKGTSAWKQYFITLPVAQAATAVYFGGLLPGDGTAWFDAFQFEVDGQPWRPEGDSDLDFEAAKPSGFYLGGNGYAVEVDSDNPHTGRQSLRMRFLSNSQPAGTNPKEALDQWSKIMEHLSAGAAGYVAKGASKKDVDWAIQNARVVVQAMQQRSGQNIRDRAMAENVRWILEQNPKAKIVLWAHNGHVRTDLLYPGPIMGKELRSMYGEQMRVFGFAFNQGSFRAVDSKNGLIEHTVGPAPAGGFDAMLASAGIPLLALDLRSKPEGGPAAKWLSEPQTARSIGAVFSQESAANFFTKVTGAETFDVILFVDKTTAARPVTATR